MLTLDVWLITLIVLKTFLYITAFMSVGLHLFNGLVSIQNDNILRWIKHKALSAVVFLLFFSIAYFMALTGQLSDAGLSGLFDFEILILLLNGPSGSALLLRILATIFLIVALYSITFHGFLIGVGAFLMALSFVVVGHANHDFWLLAPLIILHVLIVGFWFGSLGPLYVALSFPSHLKEAVFLLERFSKLAFYSVVILLSAGVLAAYILLGTLNDLFFTEYGRVLLIKISFVVLLLSLALANKYRFVPALKKGNKKAIGYLKKSILLEVFLFLLIFSATAFLTSAVNLPHHH